MANTFELISSVTVGSGGASSIDFTSIPATYTDLCLQYSLRNSRGSLGPSYLYMSLNGSTSNFTFRYLARDWDTPSSARSGSGSTRAVSLAVTPNAATSNTFGSGSIYIPNYAGSTYKSISADTVSENNGTDSLMDMFSTLWSDTSAITSIGLATDNSPFLQYSTAYLYGVKNA